jgi:catechol 2,3-dioxygenase-like lactoylglutathione lyase family enzyme
LPDTEVRRSLHSNYNCKIEDLEILDKWYTDLFALKPIMRTHSDDTDAVAFGVRQVTETDTIFLYDHRGARRTTSLELVGWLEPLSVGTPYAKAWEHGIQSVGYVVDDLDRIADYVAANGGTLVKRIDRALLLRDPVGVNVEVYDTGAAEQEAHHMRLSVHDRARSIDWYANLGYTENPEAIVVPGAELFDADGDHAITSESAMSGTDDRTYSLILTEWSGGPPQGPSYAAHFHTGVYRFAVAVDDVQASYEQLRDSGVAVYPPYTFALPGTPITEGLTILFIRDPDGILVELVQRPRSFFR